MGRGQRALNEDGTLRQTPWLKIIGEDYIAKAFEFAHEADPKAELYYNDYSLENEAKRKGAVELIEKLKARESRSPPSGCKDTTRWTGPPSNSRTPPSPPSQNSASR